MSLSIKTKAQRRWSATEINSILDFMKNTVKSGKNIEKPTADQYYAGMIGHLKLFECNVAQAKGKIRHLKTSYVKTIAWRNETGQGVLLEHGDETFLEATLKKCPYFTDLDEIFGSKLSIFPPVVLQSSQADFVPVSNEVSMDDTDNCEVEEANIMETSGQPPVKKTKKATEANIKVKKDEGSVAALVECRRNKSETDKLKINLETEKLAFEKTKWAEELSIKDRELRIKEKELDLQQKRIDQESELKKYELDLQYKVPK